MNRNKMIFDEAFEYLLKLPGINREIILMHLHEWKNGKPTEINGENGLFYKMLEHAKSRRDMTNTIGNLNDLSEILYKFNLELVSKEFKSNEEPLENLFNRAYAILVNVPYFGIMNVKKIYFLKKLC